MKINTRKLLLGIALLGATSLSGFSTPAFAEDKDDRKDLKEARKEVKEARKDVRKADSPEERRDAREDLREEKRDYSEEKRENRPGTVGSTRTLEGVVTQDLPGNDFTIRLWNGQIVRVYAVNGENGSISRNDTVRVSGYYSGAAFRARAVSILRNR